MVALIGASGSGKSTLIRHLAGLERSDREGGSIAVFDRPMQTEGRLATGARIVHRINENNPDAFAKIKMIWKSPLIPSDPIVWRAELSDESKARVEKFFLTFGTPESDGEVTDEREILARHDGAPFRKSSNDQLLPIRIMEISKEPPKIKASDLAAAEKAAELEAREAGYQTRFDSMKKS